MGTGREVIVSRGPWPEARVRDGLELLFDDGSTDPYALHLSAESADRLPLPEDVAREWIFTAWVLRDGQPHKALERPCYYRLVPAIPDLSPRRSPGAN
jgi:hypothetical protein